MNKDLTFNAHAGQGRGLTYSIHRIVLVLKVQLALKPLCPPLFNILLCMYVQYNY